MHWCSLAFAERAVNFHCLGLLGQVRGCDALTLSMAGLVELARPCSISGAVKVDTSSDRPQFLNAKVPVADSSKEVGLMMLHILFWPGKKNRKSIIYVILLIHFYGKVTLRERILRDKNQMFMLHLHRNNIKVCVALRHDVCERIVRKGGWYLKCFTLIGDIH